MAMAKSLTRRWFQFRLGKLLGAMAVVGLACGWWSDHVRQERRREYAETMLKAYQTCCETKLEELDELLEPSAPLRNNFRNVGIGSVAEPDSYASAEEFIEDLRAAGDWGAVGKVCWRARVSGVIEAATPELIRLLKSPNAEWRERAALLLGEGGAREDVTAGALAGAMTDASVPVRRRGFARYRGTHSRPRSRCLVESDQGSASRCDACLLARRPARRSSPGGHRFAWTVGAQACGERGAETNPLAERPGHGDSRLGDLGGGKAGAS